MIRVYADTSVFGGVFDDEFKDETIAFFDLVKQRKFQLVISSVVSREIQPAPEKVKDFFKEMITYAELVEITSSALQLRQGYIDAGVVTNKSMLDALHVALASVSGCSMIVSWNFKHIVHFQKIPLYRAINAVKGYAQIDIYSPLEVINYEG
ncbi:type II toxin-antitoxin system VapC family toxin [Crocosphaera sp.]|uniref:type II toxin-antitoxin system VapC family toxin n=1 Tax=Crocosphaera sp. TaxID=2729996 RepID=UPI003F24D987